MAFPHAVDPNLRLDILVKANETRSASTQDGYLTDIVRTSEAVRELTGRFPTAADFMDLDRPALDRIVALWQRDDLAASTIRRRLVSLRKYARLIALELGVSGAILTAEFPCLPVTPTWVPPVPDIGDLQIAVERSDNWPDARDLAVMSMAACHGLSISELLPLAQGSIVDGTLVVLRPGRCPRILTLDSTPTKALGCYRDRLPVKVSQAAPLWLNQSGDQLSRRMLQLAMQRVRRRLGWSPDAVAGLFRRHRMLRMAESGVPLIEIATEMGIGVETVGHHLRT